MKYFYILGIMCSIITEKKKPTTPQECQNVFQQFSFGNVIGFCVDFFFF